MKHTWWIAPVVFLLDRITKALALRLPQEGWTLIQGVLGLRLMRNTGMAFSLFGGHSRLLGVLSLALIAGAFLFLWKKQMSILIRVGLMMMLGGAAGNAVDRLIWGYVTDMVEPLFMNFAVFNLADACLVTGCMLIIMDLFRKHPENSK